MDDIQDLIAELPTQGQAAEGSTATQNSWSGEQIENWLRERSLQNEKKYSESTATEGINKTKTERKGKNKVLTTTSGKVKTEKEAKTVPTK